MARRDFPVQKSHDIIEVDKDLIFIGLPASVLEALLKLERPMDCLGLANAYLYFYVVHKKTPSTTELSKFLGVGPHKIAAIRKVLKENCFIETYAIKDKETGRIVGNRTSIRNLLRNGCFPDPGKSPPSINYVNTETPGNSNEFPSVCSVCKKKMNGKGKTPTKEFPRERDFDALWAQHPRKKNKQEARRAWKEKEVQKNLPPIDALLTSHAKDAEEWREARFTPHLSTWLRGHRWENHLGTTVVNDDIGELVQLTREMQEMYEEPLSARQRRRRRPYFKWVRQEIKAGNITEVTNVNIFPPNGELYLKWKEEYNG